MQSIGPSITRDLRNRIKILRFAQDDLLSQVRFLAALEMTALYDFRSDTIIRFLVEFIPSLSRDSE